MPSRKRKRSTSCSVNVKKSRSQAFLDTLSVDESKVWLDEIIPKGPYEKLVNWRHISSVPTMKELKSATSIGPFNGAYFIEWMQCLIREDLLLVPPAIHTHLENLDDDINIDELAELVSVTPEDGDFFKDWLSCYVTAASAETTTPAYNDTILNHDLKLEFLQPKLNMFCTSNHIRLISVRSHHVVLRCKLKKKLSKFTTKDGGNTASHLCDVKNCLRPEHLIIENMAMNVSRLACPGVILILQNQEPNTPKKIMQIKPCQHGINHRNASGNFLKFSCRKIQVMIEDAAIAVRAILFNRVITTI
ncbi:unnamed protein product [Adineta steineri]|uniref:Zinc-binding loop region of homing endonuclease domain-containing protein n=1 Tax=Adineta steineri TaxID=433720 RepID=A0A815UUM0_9BILA|nr:unnamed protein product [Adineta steineri]CAF1651185.1 unnamed protein product [Adineta steineri]